jgi:hypothetical protein
MPTIGHRYRLIIYTYLMNRWWRATLAIGITLLIIAGGLGGLPVYLPQFPVMWVEDWKLWLAGGAGGFAIFITILLAALRNSAYIKPFEKHLHLATPFLHVNISYQRLRRTYTDEFQRLFPPKKMKGWKRELVEPLAGRTAIILEFTSLPVPLWTLRLFLSPFFFPDRTPRLAILTSDWMALSTELESLRGNYIESQRTSPQKSPVATILTGIRKSPK